MPKRLIIDCDPGIDDAIALVLAMFDPRLEVTAITAAAGSVDAERTTRNTLALVERTDPPRHPRVGAACDPDDAPVSDFAMLHGQEGLGAWHAESASRQHLIASDKLLAEEVRANSNDITLLCTGPLTNVAKMLNRDPKLATEIQRVIMVGGSVTGQGDVTAAAEFNMHFDPVAADQVFRSPTTKILIPLEVVNQLAFGMELLDCVTNERNCIGEFLKAVVPYYYRATRQQLGKETITLPAVLGWLMVTEPSLFTTSEESVEVETDGRLSRGILIVDRRSHVNRQANMEVATGLDVEAAKVAFYRGLKFAMQHSC